MHTRLAIVWGFAAACLSCLPVAAEPVEDPPAEDPRIVRWLQQLVASPQPPDVTRRAVAGLSDPEVVLAADQLAVLFDPGSPRGAWIAGAQIAADRADPAFAELMFTAFVQSKFDMAAHDPDVFEALLRGLQALPDDAVKRGIEEADLSSLTPLVARRLRHNWLDPLGGLQGGASQRAMALAGKAVDAKATQWLSRLVDAGADGLVFLQTDSGDDAFALLSECEVVLLAAMLASGSDEEAALAEEVVWQRGFSREELSSAHALLAPACAQAGGCEDARVVAITDALPSVPPLSAAQRVIRSGRTYPFAGPVSAGPFDASPLLEAPRRTPWLRVLVLAVAAAALVLGWWSWARRSFVRRKATYRIAAVAFAPALLLLAEAALTLAGVDPQATHSAAFDPGRTAARLFQAHELDGRDHLVTHGRDIRYRVFEQDKSPNALRVFAHGASSVHGSNYLADEAWPAVLGRRLRSSLGTDDLEVINCGFGGTTSDSVIHHVREALELDADLVVVSLGYNDFVHLPRLTRYAGWSTPRFVLQMVLTRSRVVELMARVLPTRTAAPDSMHLAEGWAPDDDQRLRMLPLVGRNLEANLVQCHRDAREAGVDMVFVLQAQNEDLCGEGSAAGAAPEVQVCYPSHAREAVGRAAARTGMTVVDPLPLLQQHAGDAPVGSDYYWDTIHATALGNAIIGEAAAPAVAEVLRQRL